MLFAWPPVVIKLCLDFDFKKISSWKIADSGRNTILGKNSQIWVIRVWNIWIKITFCLKFVIKNIILLIAILYNRNFVENANSRLLFHLLLIFLLCHQPKELKIRQLSWKCHQEPGQESFLLQINVLLKILIYLRPGFEE